MFKIIEAYKRAWKFTNIDNTRSFSIVAKGILIFFPVLVVTLGTMWSLMAGFGVFTIFIAVLLAILVVGLIAWLFSSDDYDVEDYKTAEFLDEFILRYNQKLSSLNKHPVMRTWGGEWIVYGHATDDQFIDAISEVLEDTYTREDISSIIKNMSEDVERIWVLVQIDKKGNNIINFLCCEETHEHAIPITLLNLTKVK